MVRDAGGGLSGMKIDEFSGTGTAAAPDEADDGASSDAAHVSICFLSAALIGYPPLAFLVASFTFASGFSFLPPLHLPLTLLYAFPFAGFAFALTALTRALAFAFGFVLRLELLEVVLFEVPSASAAGTDASPVLSSAGTAHISPHN